MSFGAGKFQRGNPVGEYGGKEAVLFFCLASYICPAHFMPKSQGTYMAR